jgi:tRNA-intron endonuclease
MKKSGELINSKIIVKKAKDIGQLYNKSHFGKSIIGNKLQLDLLEGVYLLGEGKIRIFQDEKEVDFQELIKIASNMISKFEIKYLVFKDLRNRGHAIRLCNLNNITFCQFKSKKEVQDNAKQFFVTVFSERDIFDIEKTREFIKTLSKQNDKLWFAIVDEEGDLTYYEVSSIDIKGDSKEHFYLRSKAVLLENRVVIFEKDVAHNLFEKEFFGKSFGDGLQLSLVEALYLSGKGFIDVNTSDGKKISKEKLVKVIQELQPDINLRLKVFKDLKKRGLIVKTGFKFGSHFRAYTKKPDETHAEYLIHVIPIDFKGIWAEISRAVRLAHSVNKEIVFAQLDHCRINYIKFGRLRP